MAKVIKYNICTKVNHGTEESPNYEDVFYTKGMSWSESNEAIAKAEAYNGEYTIEDDGIEQITEPSTSEILDALLGA